VAVEFFPAEGRLWVGVTGTGIGEPIVRTRSVTAEHGRGRQLVGLLSGRWAPAAAGRPTRSRVVRAARPLRRVGAV